MAFLIVSGITVSVAQSSPSRSKEIVGDAARAFDGTFRQTVRARKRSWKVSTTPIARATADTLEAALESTTLPLVCSGDMMGATVNCFCPAVDSWTPVKQTSTTHLVVVEFTLAEQ